MSRWEYLSIEAAPRRLFVWAILLTVLINPTFEVRLRAADNEASLSPLVNAYFKQYCHRCHGKTIQKGDRRLDEFPANGLLDESNVDLLAEVLDAVNRGDMPPNKKGISRPSADETRRVVTSITQFLEHRVNASKPATTNARPAMRINSAKPDRAKGICSRQANGSSFVLQYQPP